MFPYPFSFLTIADTGLATIDNVYSMEFDGVDDYIRISIPTFASEFTISAWIYPTGIGPGYDDTLMGTYDTNSNKIEIATTTTMNVKIGGSTSAIAESGGNDFVNDAWQHIFIYRDSGDDVYVYRNGTPFGSSDNNTNTLTIDSIGKFYAGGPRLWEGKLDEIAFWDSDQSAEIANIYNATSTGKTADLSDMATPPTAWYRMGD